MKFTKMHGCGNDYVYVNGFTEKVADKPKAVVALSDRHFGIGSDGVIFINPSQQADFEMEMYNADGLDLLGEKKEELEKYYNAKIILA